MRARRASNRWGAGWVVAAGALGAAALPAVGHAQSPPPPAGPVAPSSPSSPGTGGAPPSAGGGAADEYKQAAADLDGRLNELLAIPEVPAAFALGVSVETVAHPGTVRDAVAAVTAHIDSNGDLKPGLAIEAAPFRPLFAKYDIAQWRDQSVWVHMLDSLRLSLATSTDPSVPAGSTPSTLAAAGLRIALLDQRDYRYNSRYIEAVRAALTLCAPGGGQATTTGTPPAAGHDAPVGEPGQVGIVPVSADCAQRLKDTIQVLDQTLTTGHRLELDAAMTFAQGQPASNVDWRSAHFWLAYDYGFNGGSVGGAGDVLLHDDAAGTLVTDLTAGARMSLGPPNVSWSLSALVGSIAQTSNQRDTVVRYGVALAVKMVTYGAAKIGLQGSHDFDSHADGAILFVNLSAANGETFYEKAVAKGTLSPAPGGR